MSGITTHILDATLGQPACNVVVRLFVFQADQYILLDQKTTDQDGRVKNFDLSAWMTGIYQIQFETLPYFVAQQQQCFYPRVSIEFMVTALDRHYHVPLLISPFSYSTYRGS